MAFSITLKDLLRAVKIVAFFIIFYACLAVFWVACLLIFLMTIDRALPRYYGPGTIIGTDPGVNYQPRLKDDPESTLIRFTVSDPKSYAPYTEALNAFVEKYYDVNRTKHCFNESNADIVLHDKIRNENADPCRFNLSVFKEGGCSKENDFGFKDGNPCVILYLNRLIGWAPDDYEDSKIPIDVLGRYQQGSIAFHCEGNGEDKELLQPVSYIPLKGIDGRFFPYAATFENYHQPFAMVKFTGLPPNRLLIVECRAYAKNIKREEERRLGMVKFELLRQVSSGNKKST